MQIPVTQEHIDQGVRGMATQCPVALAIKAAYTPVECHPLVGYHVIDLALQHSRTEFDILFNLSRWIGDFDNLRHVDPVTISLNLSKKTARIIRGNR